MQFTFVYLNLLWLFYLATNGSPRDVQASLFQFVLDALMCCNICYRMEGELGLNAQKEEERWDMWG